MSLFHVIQGDMKTATIIQGLEDMVAFKKGKGKHSHSMLTIKVDASDEEVEKSQETLSGEVPRIIAFFNTEGDLESTVICGDNRSILVNGDLYKAVLTLLASYYVFDIDYPRCFAMALGFFQQSVLQQPFTEVKNKSKGFADTLALVYEQQ